MINISDIPNDAPINVIVGAGDQRYDGWIATQGYDLNLCCKKDWEESFGVRKIDSILCEHVWEHLTYEEGTDAAAICFEFLKPGGRLRCAVPDANFPDENYQNLVKVGGPGPLDHPAADHKIVYDHLKFCSLFERAGFKVDLLEYCDKNGRFHFNYWNPKDGMIFRSLLNDPRNKPDKLGFVSLIIDAFKPN